MSLNVVTPSDTLWNSSLWNNSSNTTDRCSVNHNQELESRTFIFVVYVCIFGPICVLGLLGNTLSFLVLQRDTKSHDATFLLKVLAVADNSFLVCAGASLVYGAVLLFVGVEVSSHWFLPYMQVFVNPLVHMTQLVTVYVTVLIAFNRYYAICHPFSSERKSWLNAVKKQVVFAVSLAVIYCIPRFFEFSISCWNKSNNFNSSAVDNDVIMDCIVGLEQSSRHYRVIYQQALYCVFVFLGPCLLIASFNIAIIIAITCPKEGISSFLSESELKERRNITVVMLTIVAVFLITQTPAFINQILAFKFEDVCIEYYFYFYHISNLVAASNSSLNFVIYCACRPRFRRRLWLLPCVYCCFRRTYERHRDEIRINSRNSTEMTHLSNSITSKQSKVIGR